MFFKIDSLAVANAVLVEWRRALCSHLALAALLPHQGLQVVGPNKQRSCPAAMSRPNSLAICVCQWKKMEGMAFSVWQCHCDHLSLMKISGICWMTRRLLAAIYRHGHQEISGRTVTISASASPKSLSDYPLLPYVPHRLGGFDS